jgi:Asp-tRNA(Asn)/Glu-tRNA(Gln) amidotransferase A subunit family amidase
VNARPEKSADRCTGIPILIKDNIATADSMQTTAGSLAMIGARAPRDAHLVISATQCGCNHAGQDQPERMGQYPFKPVNQWLECPRGVDP